MEASWECKIDVVKLPNSYNQANLEWSRLHGVEHYLEEEFVSFLTRKRFKVVI